MSDSSEEAAQTLAELERDVHNSFMLRMSTWLPFVLTRRGHLPYPRRLSRSGLNWIIERLWRNDPPVDALVDPDTRTVIRHLQRDLRTEFNREGATPESLDVLLVGIFPELAAAAEAIVLSLSEEDYTEIVGRGPRTVPEEIHNMVNEMAADSETQQQLPNGPRIVALPNSSSQTSTTPGSTIGARVTSRRQQQSPTMASASAAERSLSQQFDELPSMSQGLLLQALARHEAHQDRSTPSTGQRSPNRSPHQSTRDSTSGRNSPATFQPSDEINMEEIITEATQERSSGTHVISQPPSQASRESSPAPSDSNNGSAGSSQQQPAGLVAVIPVGIAMSLRQAERLANRGSPTGTGRGSGAGRRHNSRVLPDSRDKKTNHDSDTD